MGYIYIYTCCGIRQYIYDYRELKKGVTWHYQVELIGIPYDSHPTDLWYSLAPLAPLAPVGCNWYIYARPKQGDFTQQNWEPAKEGICPWKTGDFISKRKDFLAKHGARTKPKRSFFFFWSVKLLGPVIFHLTKRGCFISRYCFTQVWKKSPSHRTHGCYI